MDTLLSITTFFSTKKCLSGGGGIVFSSIDIIPKQYFPYCWKNDIDIENICREVSANYDLFRRLPQAELWRRRPKHSAAPGTADFI